LGRSGIASPKVIDLEQASAPHLDLDNLLGVSSPPGTNSDELPFALDDKISMGRSDEQSASDMSLDDDMLSISIDDNPQGMDENLEPGLDEVSVNEVSLGDVSLDEVGLDAPSVDEVSLDEVGLDAPSVDEVSVGEVSLGEVSLDDVGLDAPSVDEVSVGEVSLGDVGVDDAAQDAESHEDPADPKDLLTQRLDEIRAGAAGEDEGGRLAYIVAGLLDFGDQQHELGSVSIASQAICLAFDEAADDEIAQQHLAKREKELVRMLVAGLGETGNVPHLLASLTDIPSEHINSRAAFLLTRLDGEMTLDELLDISGMPKLEALRHLSGLHNHGYLELV